MSINQQDVFVSQFSQALSIQAVLGTRRPAKPLPLDAVLSAFVAELPEQSAEQRLLAVLAGWSVYARAGQQCQQGAMVTPIAAVVEQNLPTVLQRMLPVCLADNLSILRYFWQQAASAVGGVLQAESLIAALQAGRQQVALRLPLVAHLGQRAQLLASRQPDWVWAQGVTHPLFDVNDLDTASLAVWQTGHASARELLFQRMRQTDPIAALQQLQKVWPTETATIRQAFLAALQEDLTDADEPFLQSVLEQDRSRVVREQAAQLLSKLPNSAFAQRQQQRFEQWVSWDAKTKQPVFAEIEQIDTQMEQDGWNPKATTQNGLGVKAQALLYFISVLPLSCWQMLPDLNPAHWFKALQKHDWRDAIVSGLYRAACSQKNAMWAQVLLQHPMKQTPHHQLAIDAVQLVLLIDSTQQEAWCLTQLKAATGRNAYTEVNMLQQFCTQKIQQLSQPLMGFWSLALTEQVLSYLKKYQDSKQYECAILAQLLVCCADLTDLAQQQFERSPEARQAEQLRRQLLGCLAGEVGR